MKRVSDPQVSPDGRFVAYVVGAFVAGRKRQVSHIWLVSTAGTSPARLFTTGDGSDSSPRWSPDGESVAFLSSRRWPSALAVRRQEGCPADPAPEPQRQLWIISESGGEAVPFFYHCGGIKKFEWSEDGKEIAFIATDPKTKNELEAERAGFDQVRLNSHYRFDRLWILGVTTRKARRLSGGDMNVDDFAWSPDGTEILARISPTPSYNDRWYVSKIVIFNSVTGAVERTVLDPAAYMPLSWSPHGHRVAVSRRVPGRIARVPLIYNLASGSETVIGKSYDATIHYVEWAPDGGLVAAAVEGTMPVLLRVNSADGSVARLAGIRGPSEFSGFTMSRDGKQLAYVAETPQHPGEICVMSGGTSRVLAATNPQVAQWKLGTSMPLTWKSSLDGKRIFGVVLLPPGYHSGQRYKTVVWVHGGPEEAWLSGFHGTWYDWSVILASHGYVVLLPNPRGSDGQSTAFIDSNYQAWGDGDFHDIMDGVDALIARGITDPARMGIGGWSYGGFMTAWAVTHTQRFRAAVVGAPVTDLFSFATTSDIAPGFTRDYWGHADFSLLDGHSPTRFLEHCTTPVLVLVGGADARVTLSQSEEFYNGLHDLGKEVEMVVYPREHHIFVEKDHQFDSLRRMLAWYDAHMDP